MPDEVKCFLVEPVYATTPTLQKDARDWEPNAEFEILEWIRKDTGEVKTNLHQFGPGAMWYATWIPKNFSWDNETEPHLIVATPGGDWDTDSRCSNCTMPEDRTHRCWVRHGEPPNITVDKNGNTCKAGAGSIQTARYHGKLIGGVLRPC